jgi:hypothetical protein
MSSTSRECNHIHDVIKHILKHLIMLHICSSICAWIASIKFCFEFQIFIETSDAKQIE